VDDEFVPVLRQQSGFKSMLFVSVGGEVVSLHLGVP
jgi:hypothetical protein